MWLSERAQETPRFPSGGRRPARRSWRRDSVRRLSVLAPAERLLKKLPGILPEPGAKRECTTSRIQVYCISDGISVEEPSEASQLAESGSLNMQGQATLPRPDTMLLRGRSSKIRLLMELRQSKNRQFSIDDWVAA
jgi:hypothetical protein